MLSYVDAAGNSHGGRRDPHSCSRPRRTPTRPRRGHSQSASPPSCGWSSSRRSARRRAVRADQRRPAVRPAHGRVAGALGRRRPGQHRSGAKDLSPASTSTTSTSRATPPTGCDYEHWARRIAVGQSPTVYAHVATDPGHPGKLALQYWLFYVFNDWNNLHEGDWEMIQLVFDASTPARGAAALAGRGGLQPARGRGAGGLGRRQARASSTARTRSCTRPPDRTRTSTARRSTSAARLGRASAATTRAGRRRRCARPCRRSRATRRAARRGLPLDRLRGPLGRAAAGVLQRPDRAEPEDAVDAADPLVRGLARAQLRRAGAAARSAPGATDFFCGAVARRLERPGAARRPAARVRLVARRARRCSSSFCFHARRGGPSAPLRLARRRGWGQILAASGAHVPRRGSGSSSASASCWCRSRCS